MKYIFFAVVLFAVPTFAQGVHAPTKDVCQADAAVWVHVTAPELAKVHYEVIAVRRTEMHDCREVDPESAVRYIVICLTLENEMRWRLEQFVNGKGLNEAFFKADANQVENAKLEGAR